MSLSQWSKTSLSYSLLMYAKCAISMFVMQNEQKSLCFVQSFGLDNTLHDKHFAEKMFRSWLHNTTLFDECLCFCFELAEGINLSTRRPNIMTNVVLHSCNITVEGTSPDLQGIAVTYFPFDSLQLLAINISRLQSS